MFFDSDGPVRPTFHPSYKYNAINRCVPHVDKFSAVLMKSDEIIIFNVGGTKFEVLKSNFAYWPTTRLSRLVRASTKEEILNLCGKFISTSISDDGKSTKQEYYFYRNWSNFNAILDLYRKIKLHAPIHICCTNYHEDLEYWGIDEIILDPCCAIKYLSLIHI